MNQDPWFGTPFEIASIHAMYVQKRKNGVDMLALCLYAQRAGSPGDPINISTTDAVDCGKCLAIIHG